MELEAGRLHVHRADDDVDFGHLVRRRSAPAPLRVPFKASGPQQSVDEFETTKFATSDIVVDFGVASAAAVSVRTPQADAWLRMMFDELPERGFALLTPTNAFGDAFAPHEAIAAGRASDPRRLYTSPQVYRRFWVAGREPDD